MFGDVMSGGTRMKTTPIAVDRSVRQLDIRGLTSVPAGKVVPIAAWGLLREDRLNMSRFLVNLEMLETVELLVNPVHCRVQAWLVPHLAFSRFQGSMDQLNRSYMKQPQIDGGSVVDFYDTIAFDRDTQLIHTYMGKHAREDQQVNTAYIEAYNAIWNFRAKNRSPDITLRTDLQVSLAKAFWINQRFSDIVPDFDQAVIEGEVPLTVVDGLLHVKGLGFTNSSVGSVPSTSSTVRESGEASTSTMAKAFVSDPSAGGGADNKAALRIREDPAHLGWPLIQAELAENGISVSLANIDMARRTQAFAALRKQYNQHDDDYIIDLLMSGIQVPEQAWAQPMLLADQTTIYGMNKRYSSSADDLTASVVNGGSVVELALTSPRCPTGGVVMITIEVAPEQLYERQMDPYLIQTDQAVHPEFLRDTLDPEKVDVVQNQYVDMDHDTPTATFGYAPLNHAWSRIGPMIGGKFYRPTVNAAFDEDRQRLWAVETENPTLAEDFYLVTNLHQKPFVVTNQDNFESVIRGSASIEGNTVFGRLLVEASNDYETVMEKAPIETIDKD